MAKIIDGKKIAEELKQEIKDRLKFQNGLRLVVILVGDNPVSLNYVKHKKLFGEELGIEVVIFEFGPSISEEDLESEMNKLADDDNVNGIIVQLPLPKNFNTSKILSLIPPEKDVDALSKEPLVLSPVVKSVSEILTRSEVDIAHKKIVVVGDGQLVGRPVAVWATSLGADVSQIKSKQTKAEMSGLLEQADVIISGVGQPNLITKDMIKKDVVLIDAATSEEGGRLVGDIDKECVAKSSLFTPVPGGVGPITMAMLFMNLVDLNQ